MTVTRWMSLVVVVLSCLTATTVGQQKPNVIVVMADDLGYSDLGCYGGEIETPHLDRLAKDGLRFSNFYSENMCWVSRAAMLTGIYHKSSMFKNGLHPRCVTLSEAMRHNGYQTRMSGKWHLAGRPYQFYPNDRGFDEFYGILGGAASYFAPAFLCRDKTNVESEATDDPDYYFTGTSIPHEVIDKRQENRSPMKMDGISLAPIFDGDQIRGHETLFFAHARGQALRQGDWKLVAIKQKKKTVNWELYNLKRDPLELNNLADQMPDKLDELAEIWSAELARLQRRANVD